MTSPKRDYQRKRRLLIKLTSMAQRLAGNNLPVIMQIAAARASEVDAEANKKIIEEMRNKGFHISDASAKELEKFETMALATATQQLADLESEFGALQEVAKSRGSGDGELAFKQMTAYGSANPGGIIRFGPSLGNAQSRLNSLTKEQAQGFKAKTDGSLDAALRYTPVHEYGHMLSFALFQRDVNSGNWSYFLDGDFNKWCGEKRNEIISIAESKYGYTGGQVELTQKGLNSRKKSAKAALQAVSSNLSEYGAFGIKANDHSEFFSEGLVQARLGDGALGKAYNDWLKSVW